MSKHIVKYAGVIIKDKKFLVVKENGENVWKNVGGKLEENETPEDCLKREIKEELGIELKEEPSFYFSLPTTKAVSDPTISLDIHLYKCIPDKTPSAHGEIEKLHWLSKEEFEKGLFELTYQI
jgi:8-oxo-dGTP diphosphatase